MNFEFEINVHTSFFATWLWVGGGEREKRWREERETHREKMGREEERGEGRRERERG